MLCPALRSYSFVMLMATVVLVSGCYKTKEFGKRRLLFLNAGMKRPQMVIFIFLENGKIEGIIPAKSGLHQCAETMDSETFLCIEECYNLIMVLENSRPDTPNDKCLESLQRTLNRLDETISYTFPDGSQLFMRQFIEGSKRQREGNINRWQHIFLEGSDNGNKEDLKRVMTQWIDAGNTPGWALSIFLAEGKLEVTPSGRESLLEAIDDFYKHCKPFGLPKP